MCSSNVNFFGNNFRLRWKGFNNIVNCRNMNRKCFSDTFTYYMKRNLHFFQDCLLRYVYHRAIFTIFILSFWLQLFIYLLNFFNSTVGLICFNLLIDFDAFCKRTECDVPKTSISCHNIYLVIYSILFDVLLM